MRFDVLTMICASGAQSIKATNLVHFSYLKGTKPFLSNCACLALLRVPSALIIQFLLPPDHITHVRFLCCSTSLVLLKEECKYGDSSL